MDYKYYQKGIRIKFGNRIYTRYGFIVKNEEKESLYADIDGIIYHKAGRDAYGDFFEKKE